ncbi:polycomb protein Sfmbt-like [Pollicipes pollicipes]|uniref:polycomb protein Sfmbt-like n=1 Tax=Pollicipes pollicipes TaxID=41117 RepID=UPI001884BF8F|nr:polycomb protein Sfmbt-like [Pollicipes pollicipes]
MAGTVPHEFAEWGYQEYSGYDPELKPDDMELEAGEEEAAGGPDARRKTTQNAKKPKVHLDPKLKLKGPITYEKDVDPSLIPIVRDGMARCQKCGAIGVRHAFYTRERKYCSLSCARSVEGLAAEPDSAPAAPRREVAHSFSWDGLLRQADFSAAPVPCFRHAPLAAAWDYVCVGLKVEVVSEPPGGGLEPACWVGTVLRVEGYRGLVRYEGLTAEESAGRWLDLCSDDVHPVGWYATQGRPLIPPPVVASRHADWSQLLVKRLTGARTLPTNFHHRVLRSLGSSLREEQVVEVVDKNCIGQVRAAAVSQVVGRRLHIRYLDAPSDDGGFWCHENSPLVHPVGWALAVGHQIAAPADYLERCQTGKYLATDVTEDWQPPLPAAPQQGFTVGMKLEALDPLNLSSIGVATVKQVLGGGYLMVRLETLPTEPGQPGGDWFCYHVSSPYIFPPRFCRTVGVPLTPPHGYTADTFTWEAYLAAEPGAQPAPPHLFQRPPLSHGFQPGQRLEAVDLMDPQLVCVATVAAVVGRLLRVHFTGWEEQFDQWVDAASPDIFPVGWCRLVGYKLEPPFLRVNECAAYCDSFQQAGVDGARLLDLTKHQVLELACWKVGPSLKIENLVQKLRARVAPAQARFMASFKKV